MKNDAIERKVSVREQVAAEKEELNKKKKNQLSDVNMPGCPLAQEQEDSEGDFPKDTDKNTAQKFKTYELSLKDIQNILTYWDRKQGVLLHHAGAEVASHENGTDQRQVPSSSGGRRGRKDRERERAERERLERERAERERLEKLRAQEERRDGGEGKEEDHEGKKDLGVPFINIQLPDSEGSSWKQALENDRLPKEDQVQALLQDGDVASQVAR